MSKFLAERSVWRWYAAAMFAVVAFPAVLLGRGVPGATLTVAPDTTLVVVAPEPGPVIEAWNRGPRPEASIAVLDPLLAERIDALRLSSPAFQAAWAELEAAGIPLMIGSSAQLSRVMPRNIRESGYWAGITLTWPEGRDGSLHRGMVAIRVDWLQDLHEEYGNPREAFLTALDGLLIHEVYGHLVPVVEARNLSAHCADPVGRQSMADSCVGQRIHALSRDRSRVLVLAEEGGGELH